MQLWRFRRIVKLKSSEDERITEREKEIVTLNNWTNRKFWKLESKEMSIH